MEKKTLPKVLVVSTNAWRDNTGINTLIEFFKCWHPDRIAQIYTSQRFPKPQFAISFSAFQRMLS